MRCDALNVNLISLSCVAYIHRRRSSVNFRGARHFCPQKYVWKINKVPKFYVFLSRIIITIPEFLLYLPEKLTKFPNFRLHDFCPKNVRILHKNCPEKNSPNFRGARAPCPLSPTLKLISLNCERIYDWYWGVMMILLDDYGSCFSIGRLKICVD